MPPAAVRTEPMPDRRPTRRLPAAAVPVRPARGARAPSPRAHEGGCVDLSVGTPTDPPTDAVIAALCSSGTERGYPPSIGTRGLPRGRRRLAGPSGRRRRRPVRGRGVHRHQGVRGRPAAVAAPAPPEPRHRAVPGGQLPELRDGRHAGRAAGPCRCRSTTSGASTSRPSTRPTPTGPCACGSTRRATRPADSTTWARPPPGVGPTGCPSSATSATSSSRGRGRPGRSSSTAPTGVVAVHSLSKRSNLAGARAGFYAGDADLVGYLSEVRKHAGFMVPGPVQAAAVAASSDDEHVDRQRAEYRAPARAPAATCSRPGASTSRCPRAASTSGSPAPDGDAWAFSRRLATEAGVLASPGEFYGEAGAGHVRLALVRPTRSSTWSPVGSACADSVPALIRPGHRSLPRHGPPPCVTMRHGPSP